jgi:hypothetical protein
MKKNFVDKWWVRVLALLVIPPIFGDSIISTVIFLAIVVFIFFRVSRNRSIKKDKTAKTLSESSISENALPVAGTYILVSSSGNFATSVAGESHYIDAISSAVNHQAGEHQMHAEIIREPDNKFDSNAVKVEIKGKTVGYISREEAPQYHDLLNHAKSINKRVFVPCRVWISDEDDSYGSVSLDIDDPNSSLPPINAADVPPSAVLWPKGNTMQVSEESKNIENVRIIFEKMKGAIGTNILFEFVIDTTKPEKPEVHVLFNNLKVGELSPASGKKFLPAIERAKALSKQLFVAGEATGNSLAAEIRVFAKSPELLSESEIKQLLG